MNPAASAISSMEVSELSSIAQTSSMRCASMQLYGDIPACSRKRWLKRLGDIFTAMHKVFMEYSLGFIVAIISNAFRMRGSILVSTSGVKKSLGRASSSLPISM